MLRPLMVVSLILPIYAAQTPAPRSIPAEPRPLVNIAKPMSATEIDFTDFEFQQPGLGHGGVTFWPLRGEPVAGKEYVVEARIWGENAIAYAAFEVLDERGQVMRTLAMGRKPELWSSRFLGMMTVPSKPFRVVLSGESTDGRPFRRVGGRLFRPVDRAPAAPAPPPGLTREEMQLFQQMVDEGTAEAIREMKEFTADHAAPVIVMPRVQVSNVTYAPFLSAAGRPLGIRIAYDVEFSAPGIFNPELRVQAEHPWSARHGTTRMHVVDSSITPVPREAYQPWMEAVLNEYRTSLLDAGAQYTYQERTVYHFVAELVPDFIVYNMDRTKQCIYRQQYRHEPAREAAHLEVLTSEAPGSYRVTISSTAGFAAKIDNFHGVGAFYRSFAAQGAPDCGPQPTRFF